MPADGDLSRADMPGDPLGARTLDELVVRLRELRAWAGLSEREVHRRVVRLRRGRGVPELPAFNTVHRCFQLGRSRLEAELLADVVRVLAGDEAAARWRAAHARIVCARDAAERTSVVTVSGELPEDVSRFVGRRAELRRLLHPGADGDGAGAAGAALGAGAVPAAGVGAAGAASAAGVPGRGYGTWLIDGMAGVGKTTLAVHAAHRLCRRERYPVVLWADLSGCARDLPPADPHAVLDAFLRRLGVSASVLRRLDPPGRAREFRARLAATRALLVLDNVAGAEQLRPLLPGVPSCLTLVTSRRRIAAPPGARRLHLEVFSPADALELLRRSVGAHVVDPASRTAARIADAVGHLPLALDVVAGRIGNSAGWTLSDHLERLTDGHGAALVDQVGAALQLSYEGLPADCRALFRLLALPPGPHLDAYAAAALTGTDPVTAGRRLELLAAANLLRRQEAGRYTLHDLVRLHAAERGHDDDPPRTRRAARNRLFDYYHRAADAAMRRYAPYEYRNHAGGPAPRADGTAPRADGGTPPRAAGGAPPPAVPRPADWRAALAWLDAERPNLVAAALRGGEDGRPELAGRLSVILHRYLSLGGHYQETEAILAHACRTPVLADRAQALAQLGTVAVRRGRHSEAVTRFRSALAVFRRIDDPVGEGWMRGNLAVALHYVGAFREAGTHLEAALRSLRALRAVPDLAARLVGEHGIRYEPLAQPPPSARNDGQVLDIARNALFVARRIEDRISECNALTNVAQLIWQEGRRTEAVAHHEESVTITRAIGYRHGEVHALNELGAALRGMGCSRRALRCHRDAAALAAEIGDAYQEARAYDGMGRCHHAADDAEAARGCWERALSRFTLLGAPEAAAVAGRLGRSGRTPGASAAPGGVRRPA